MKLHFMKYRKLSYWISGALVILSVLALLFHGLNYGIDFAGGISMEVTPVNADFTIDKMRAELAQFSPELQEADTENTERPLGLRQFQAAAGGHYPVGDGRSRHPGPAAHRRRQVHLFPSTRPRP